MNKITGAGTIKTGYTGSGYLNLTIGVDNGSSTFAGVIANDVAAGNLVKIGTGTITLTGTNTYTGSTTINAGKLSIGADLNLGAAPTAATAGKLTFDTGGLLNTTATMTLNTFRGTALTGNGGFDVNSGTTLSYAGIIAGAGVLQKTGAGALIITGTNTFTGGVNLIGGSLQIDNANRFGTNGAMNFNNGAKLITTANITLAGANTFTGNGEISPNSGTILIVSGAYSGVGSLTMSGAGTLVLSGTSSYTGGTNITAGAIQVAADANLGGAAGTLSFNNDGRLRSTGTFTTARAVTMTGAGTFNIDADQTVTISGVVSGAGLITKMGSGSGTLLLTGTNTFTSKLNVTGGTLGASSSAALGAVPAAFTADWATLAGPTTYLRATSTLALGANRGITLNDGGGLFADAATTLTADTTFAAIGTGVSVLRIGNLGATGGSFISLRRPSSQPLRRSILSSRVPWRPPAATPTLPLGSPRVRSPALRRVRSPSPRLMQRRTLTSRLPIRPSASVLPRPSLTRARLPQVSMVTSSAAVRAR